MSETVHSPEYKFSAEAMNAPIPDMTELRRIKTGYYDVPIDTSNELFNEPVVSLSRVGVAGRSYYSKPNPATGEAVPGVDPEQYLRASVAEKVKLINDLLKQPAVTAFFGRPVGLYVMDALRPITLQHKLYNEVLPRLIRQQYPGISDDDMAARRDTLIAKPSDDPMQPPPHTTGGVLDVELRYLDERGAVTEDRPEYGIDHNDKSERTFPDYYELHAPSNDSERLAQRNRRAFYSIMTGSAFGIETGFVNNPTEWWHWGTGDQLSARVSGKESAVYSFALFSDAA
jgi:D-alanyl-D-alanine dipeptidase